MRWRTPRRARLRTATALAVDARDDAEEIGRVLERAGYRTPAAALVRWLDSTDPVGRLRDAGLTDHEGPVGGSAVAFSMISRRRSVRGRTPAG